MFANFCQEIMAVLGRRIRKCLTFCAMPKSQTFSDSCAQNRHIDGTSGAERGSSVPPTLDTVTDFLLLEIWSVTVSKVCMPCTYTSYLEDSEKFLSDIFKLLSHRYYNFFNCSLECVWYNIWRIFTPQLNIGNQKVLQH